MIELRDLIIHTGLRLGKPLRHRAGFAEIHACIGAAQRARPVSYTHLDVYKRQDVFRVEMRTLTDRNNEYYVPQRMVRRREENV